ncbi:MAG: hypothetical protein J6V44_09575 [Methanobrevibacter sp.]|nr:hypothetical protein [Methanobrevibacter sp.]
MEKMNKLIYNFAERYKQYLQNDYGKWYTEKEIDDKVDTFIQLASQIKHEDNLPKLFNLVVKNEDWKYKD